MMFKLALAALVALAVANPTELRLSPQRLFDQVP